MNNSYNQQLVEKRNEKKLSLKEAAKAIGISPFFLFLYENGYFRPSKKALKKIQKFYKFKLDYSNGQEYPDATPVYKHKKKQNLKRKFIINGAICVSSLILILTGSLLFATSARNTSSHYGETYTALKEKAFSEGTSGKDMLTNLEYYYLDRSYDTESPYSADISFSFFKTNSILYFNKSTYSVNSTSLLFPELGLGRYRYQFGGSLAQSSYICDFSFQSSSKGIYFTCRVDYQGKETDKIQDFRVIVQGSSVKVDEEMAIGVFNFAIKDVSAVFDRTLTHYLEKDVSFYNDFLADRETGRKVNFAMQISGLSLLFPAIVTFFISLIIIVFYLLDKSKSFLTEFKSDVTMESEENKPLPKDLKINIGIPDYIVIWISRVMCFGSIGLILLLSLLKLVANFTPNESFLSFLQICFVSAPFLKQSVLVRSIKKSKTLFIEIIRNFLLHIFIATMETTLIGITDMWGYDIGSLVYKFLPSTIFLAVALNYLIFFFLFFTPKQIAKKGNKKIVYWRLLSLVPLGLIIMTILVGNSYNLFYGVKRNVYLDFWFSNSKIEISIVCVLFIYSLFFLRLFFQKKYGRKAAARFYNGNLYMLLSNIICLVIIMLVGLIDIAFIKNEVGHYLGMGNNVWLLTLTPLILFTKSGPNTVEITSTEDPSISNVIV